MNGHAVVSKGAVKTGVVIVCAGVANSCYVCIVMFVPVRNQTQRSAQTLYPAGILLLFV